MSTLITTNLKHPSSSSNNLVLDANGKVNALKVATDLEVDNDLKFDSGYGSTVTGYGVRAWCTFNGTSTVAIDKHGNVSSITDHGTGQYTVNFSTAMPDAHYAIIGGVIGQYSEDHTYTFVTSPWDPNTANTTSASRFTTEHYSQGYKDFDHVNIIVVR